MRKRTEGKIGGDSRVDIQHKTTDKHQRLSTLFPRDLHFHLNSFSSSCFYIGMYIKISETQTENVVTGFSLQFFKG